MDMTNNVDMFTCLSNPILFIIISFLPFQEAARTCILSKRWRNIWRATKNIEFNESFFVKQGESIESKEVQRMSFIDFVRQWIVNYREPAVDKFRLSFTRPMNFRLDIEQCIEFAITRRVKVLDLDFSDPTWNEEDNDNDNDNDADLFDLPLHVYGHRVLESLKLFSCKVQVSEFKNFMALKNLSLGWVELSTSSLKALLLNCPLLESLSLKKCRKIECLDISASNLRLTTLVIDRCSLVNWISIEAPKLRSLKYSGLTSTFNFEGCHCMEEADLDFGLEEEFIEFGDILYNLLRQICCIKVLTVCSYMLQIIPTGEEPLGVSPPLEVRHLILKTVMHENEFYGISFLLKSCPYLEILSIEIGPALIFEDYEPPYEFETNLFWTQNVLVFRCITRTLKVVEIKGFKGTPNELQLLKYLINYGRVMEMVTINISRDVDNNGGNMESYLQNAQKLMQFQKASRPLQISID